MYGLESGSHIKIAKASIFLVFREELYKWHNYYIALPRSKLLVITHEKDPLRV